MDKDLLDYINSGASVADLEAAGYDLDDLAQQGVVNRNIKGSPNSLDYSVSYNFPTERAKGLEGFGTLQAYNPTMRDRLRSSTQESLTKLGIPKSLAYDMAYTLAGVENPTDGSFGMGLADLSPLGLPMGVQEDGKKVKRGLEEGDLAETGEGALGLGLSALGSVPGGQLAKKAAGKLVEKYDPSVLRSFFGPDAKKANLETLEIAKDFEELGASPEEIWTRFGWVNTPNGWRFEVDDSVMVLRNSEDGVSRGSNKEFIDHPEFFDNLNSPEFEEGAFLRDRTKSLGKYGEEGAFYPETNEINLFGVSAEPTLVHELQHAIQTKFKEKGRGYSPDAAADDLVKMLDNLGPAGSRSAKGLMELGAKAKELDTLEKVSEASKRGRKLTPEQELFLRAEPEKQERLVREIEELKINLSYDLDEAPKVFESAQDFIKMGEDIYGNMRGSSNLFAKGRELSTDAKFSLYELEAGEAEARMAGNRAKMSESERALTLPKLDVDPSSVYTKEGMREVFSRPLNFNQGGHVEPVVDPVSGNEVPQGALPEEVRDDVDAKLSKGEYVLPADVVRYLGLEKIEALVKKAKQGIEGVAKGEPTGEEDLPFALEELVTEDAPLEMATGGFVNPVADIYGESKEEKEEDIPFWMKDREANVNAQNDRAQPERKGIARSIGEWDPKDFSTYADHRNNQFFQGVDSYFASKLPFGRQVINKRNENLEAQAPDLIDKMISSGMTLDGTRQLTKDEVSSLQATKDKLAADGPVGPVKGLAGFAASQVGLGPTVDKVQGAVRSATQPARDWAKSVGDTIRDAVGLNEKEETEKGVIGRPDKDKAKDKDKSSEKGSDKGGSSRKGDKDKEDRGTKV